MTRQPASPDRFAKTCYLVLPLLVPAIVIMGTAAFTWMIRAWLWLPLVLMYWITIWSFTLLFHVNRGGVFRGERFKPTLKLRGKHAWLQYLVVYGPLVYAVPLFLVQYASRVSLPMLLAILATALVNGPTEEIYWRACVDEAGALAGYSKRHRLACGPVMFAFWHTGFVFHLFPPGPSWFISWAGILFMTWTSGLAWHWTLHRSGRLVPQIVYHVCSNVLNVFPMILIGVLGVSF